MDISAYQHMNIRMSTRGKRPLRNLTPSDKVRAIQRIHNGETKASVSRDIGVPESTLRGWCKNEQKLRFMCRQLGTADQLTVMPGIENPPEKRPRFDNHIQTPKYSGGSSFEEFGYNRLPLNGLSFPSSGSNAILEKIAFNEIMKKHMTAAENSIKSPVESMSAQMSDLIGGSIPVTGGFNSQMSVMQNLNLLSLLSPNLSVVSNFNGNDTFDAIKNKTHHRIMDEIKDNPKNNTNISINNNSNKNNNNQNSTVSLSVKNWAKDPAEKALLNLSNPINVNSVANNTATKKAHTNNDSNNNRVKEVEISNFQPTHPLGLLQIPSANYSSDSETGNNAALLEWYKIFNASLNFLALAAAAATLQPNGNLFVFKKEDNILYKELTKTANLFDAANNPTSFVNSDLSNDSYFESEPEDLSVRSAVTSKLSSPAQSRSESPVKSTGSSSPLHSDIEH